MPQLDFSVFPSQFFWLTICFFTLLFIMSKFIIPKIGEMINLRKEKIDSELAAADRLKKQVEEGIERYETALREASQKANLALQKTKDELNETVNRKQSDLAARLNAEIEQGEQRIEAAKDKALQKIEDAAANLTVDILAKFGFAKIKVDKVKKTLASLEEE